MPLDVHIRRSTESRNRGSELDTASSGRRDEQIFGGECSDDPLDG
jgi:hypothetical protein